MAESPENKNSENTLFMRLSAVFLTIRGNKKEKNQKNDEQYIKNPSEPDEKADFRKFSQMVVYPKNLFCL